MPRFFPSVVLFLFLSLSLVSCGKKEVTEEPAKPSLFKKEKVQEGVVSVTSFRVVSREVPLGLTTDGTTELSGKQEVKAPGPVKVARLFVEEGQVVSAGDPLLRYDDELTELKLEVARAEVKEAEEALALGGNQAEEPLDFEAENQAEAKAEEQPAAEGEINAEQPSSNLLNGRDKTDLYQAQLDRAKAQQELLERALEVNQLNSPIAGTVTNLTAQEGVEVTENQVLMSVVTMDPIDFVFKAPVDILSYLEREPDISITFPTLPGRSFNGEVAVIGTEVQTDQGEVEVKLRIPNGESTLRQGMKGEIVIRTTGRRRTLAIPVAALIKSERTDYVYKIEDNRIHKVAVEARKEDGGQVSITKGLTDGDLIVASAKGGMQSLGDGGEVEVENAETTGEGEGGR